MRSSRGGRPTKATSAVWSATIANTPSRLPTLSVRPTPAWASEKDRMRAGTNDSAAVVTAAMFSSRALSVAASSAVLVPRSSSPITSVANGAKAAPAAVGRTPRPSRSSSAVPTSRDSAVTAAETDGWVTTSSSAAPVTDPVRMTARKLRSWVRVIDTTGGDYR